MKIEFSKEEYKTLVDSLFIADWVLHSQYLIDEMPEETKRFKEFEQKIYKLAEKFGFLDLIETSETKTGIEYCANRKFEEQNQKFIEKFEDFSFWEELLDKLSDRDVLNSISKEENEEMGVLEYWKLKAPFEEKYATELSECGIERLHIKKQ